MSCYEVSLDSATTSPLSTMSNLEVASDAVFRFRNVALCGEPSQQKHDLQEIFLAIGTPSFRSTLSLETSSNLVRDAMRVSEVMSSEVATCSPSDEVRQAARLMVENDCGMIPVVTDRGIMIGVITDRDIACRSVAEGKSPDTSVEAVMSTGVASAALDYSLEECCDIMEQKQIRRMPVVDDQGICCGIISQADIAQAAGTEITGELVREVSDPVGSLP